ncbi:MAG: DHH family phosphoesterase [Clostridia bacterium]|nr:DHH family phosphoesterase [Clostridia bacterium]
MMCSLKDWLSRAGEAKRIALIAHVSPDGDTVGATLALRLAFLSLGKEADAICSDAVPVSLRFLPGIDCFLKPEETKGQYDAAIAVDVSDRRLLGKAEAVFDAAPVQMVIDHHATNPGYGQYNYVCGDECACCVLAYEAIEQMGALITPEIGTCLMTGMSTDTGHFMFPYTTPKAFEIAAKLRRIGVDVSYITRMLYRTVAMSKMNLTRRAYQKMRFELDQRVGVIALTQEDFEQTGSAIEQTDGLVNKALEVEGVRMAILATQRENGVKLSLRAVEPDTVNDIARKYGGGGHAQAAGVTMEMPMEEAIAVILSEMAQKLL